MKVKTTEEGVVTCELNSLERKALQSASSVVEQVAFHHRPAGGDEASVFYANACKSAGCLRDILQTQPKSEGA